jgi:hypothetical protein
MAFHWLSFRFPRTKFLIRGAPDEGSRWAYDIANGIVSEHDDRKPPKRASPEIEAALRQGGAIAKPYSPLARYTIGDVLEHPSFGLGLVAQFADNKIIVQFHDAERTLIHARA